MSKIVVITGKAQNKHVGHYWANIAIFHNLSTTDANELNRKLTLIASEPKVKVTIEVLTDDEQ